MLALWGLLIIIGFMVLIMTKKATPFTALVLTPIIVAAIAGFAPKIGTFALDGVKSVAPTVVLLMFAIMYFGLMLTAGLFDPLVAIILKAVKGDPLRVMVGTAILALGISVDGDGSTTTLIVCAAMIPVFNRLGMKMMDLALFIILANTIMNLLPWGGPTARIIAALNVDSGELLRRILPGMVLASVWVIIAAVLRGLSERKRLGIKEVTEEDIIAVQEEQHSGDAALLRPKMIWPNLILTLIMMVMLVFGGIGFVPKIPASIIFEVGFAIAMVLNYRSLKNQRAIIEEHAGNAMQVVVMVLAAGIFMGILNGSKMSEAMGVWLSDIMPESVGSHWPLVTALLSAPGTFSLSNDAFYLGVLPVLNETGVANGFTPMEIAIASTAGQAFHLISPLVGFIYLLLNLTKVDMGAWQRNVAKWSIGTFIAFLIGMFTLGGVRF